MPRKNVELETEQEPVEVEIAIPAAVLPEEFRAYAKPEDAMWSPLKQIKVAAERRVEEDETRRAKKEEVPLWKPPIILNAKDLLILREKRKEFLKMTVPGGENFTVIEIAAPRNWPEEFTPSFSVGAKTAKPGDRYEIVLEEALTFVDSCLFTHDREGSLLEDYAQASRLKSIGVELPERLKNYCYLPGQADFPSYWDDAENYANLWEQKRPERDNE